MADTKEVKSKKWTTTREINAIIEEMEEARKEIRYWEEQKRILVKLREEELSKDEIDPSKIEFYRDELKSADEFRLEATKKYNNFVDVYNKMEGAAETKSRKRWSKFGIISTSVLGVGGLLLTHADTVKGFIHDKGMEKFFEWGWKSKKDL